MEQINIDSYVSVIITNNIKEIEKLSNTLVKTNKNDIIFEMYNKELLTLERLKFIMKKWTKYMNMSSKLIKNLMKDEKDPLLDYHF